MTAENHRMYRSSPPGALTTTRRARAGAALALSAVLLTLSACGGGAAPVSGGATATGDAGGDKQDAPLEVSIMTLTPSTPPAADDNVLKREIEKRTNTKLTINWISNNAYEEKLNITLASGQIPDLTVIKDPFGTTFRTLVRQGAFWDITPYIKDYPNLQQGIPEVAWELTKQEDGRNYGIPRGRDADDVSFLILRKDWLDQLGLKPPTTTDELYEVLKAFKEQDPDGNGKDDTFGLSVPFDSLSGAFQQIFTGVTGSWKLEDNKLVYAPFLPETRQSLEYLAKLYKEKLLPEDQLVLKLSQARDYYKGNRAGGVIDKTGTGPNVFAPELKKIVPSYKQSDFYPLVSMNGYVQKGTGFDGILAIPKTVPEEKLKGILKLVDAWLSPEVSAVQRFGLEGVHHTVQNGVKVVDPEKLRADNASDFNQIVNSIDPALESPPANDEMRAFNEQKQQVQAERAKISRPDVGVGLYSETAQKVLPDLEKRIADLKAKIVIGREPLSAWDDFVAKTQSEPQFIKMMEEITNAYLKRSGK